MKSIHQIYAFAAKIAVPSTSMIYASNRINALIYQLEHAAPQHEISHRPQSLAGQGLGDYFHYGK